MNTNMEWLHNTDSNISNTQLEKKFDEYGTLEGDRHDLRKIFQIADDERKLEMIEYLDKILSRFNEIHENVLKKQLIAIDKWVEDILANLSTLINNNKTIDILAELD